MTTTTPRTRSRRLTPAEVSRLRAWIANGPGSVKTAAPLLRVGLRTLTRAFNGHPVDKLVAERIVGSIG